VLRGLGYAHPFLALLQGRTETVSSLVHGFAFHEDRILERDDLVGQYVRSVHSFVRLPAGGTDRGTYMDAAQKV